MIQSLYVLIVTSLACGLIGLFLVLRNMAMVSDAISHSVLLGIVLAFFLTHDLNSPLLIVGAAVFGVFTVYCIEGILKTGLVKEDAATGLVFTLFFSLAVILISKYASNVHIDTDMVLMGEVILAPLNTIAVFGHEIPKSLLYMGIVLVINIIYITLFYKELKISTFDKEFALISGFSLGFVHYSLMTLVSLTSVAAFDAVGAILVISFLITPGGTAYLLTHDLKKSLAVTAILCVINSIAGYVLAIHFNVSMSGMCATVSGGIFLIVLLFHKTGVLTELLTRKKKRETFRRELLVIHIGNHMKDENRFEEVGFDTIADHLQWKNFRIKDHINRLIELGYVKKNIEEGIYILTDSGMEYNERLMKLYGLDALEMRG